MEFIYNRDTMHFLDTIGYQIKSPMQCMDYCSSSGCLEGSQRTFQILQAPGYPPV